MKSWNEMGCRAIQGNMDPVCLFGTEKSVLRVAKSILEEVGTRPGHIFNLGHGILPGTPVKNVKALVQVVKDYSAEVKTD
jgi:uroporphyrinogen decarboxylase